MPSSTGLQTPPRTLNGNRSQSAGSRPNRSQPAGSRPNRSQPAGSRPNRSQPAGSRPNKSQPAGSRPNKSQPAGSRPNRSQSEGSSSEGPCPICFCKHNHHNCPVSDQSLSQPRMQEIDLTSTLPDYDCFARWLESPSPDNKIHTAIHVKLNKSGTAKSYIFIGDTKKKYHGSMKFTPPTYNKYIEVPVCNPALAGAENKSHLQSAIDRILKSNLYKNSRRDQRRQGVGVQKKAQFLRKEERLIQVLSSSRLYRDGRVEVRNSKGITDYHDMDTSCAVFLGDKEILNTIIRDMSVDTPPTDLICAETQGLLDCTDVTEVNEVKTCLQERDTGDRKIKTNHHLKSALKKMRRLRKDFPSHMLLTVVKYDDLIEIAIPGGSRRLGETPLECAVRTANVKAGILLDIDSNLRVKGSPEVHTGCPPDGSVMWELFLHCRNEYFFRAVASTPGEHADHVVASDLSESIKMVSISSKEITH